MPVLPEALAPWTDALAALAPDVAVALGPLVKGLDRLIADREPAPARHGVMDGFDGLSSRGHPERLLASEWLLADEAPLEFLRRAAERELLHLAPAVRTTRDWGRVAVLTDTGPGQAGAGRLVQLAALIVLHRRAADRGAELAVGLMGGREPGGWITGDLRSLLGRWLKSRRTAEPAASEAAEWSARADDADEVWLLTGTRLAAALPGRRRVMSVRESAWAETGAVRVEVAVNGGRVELPLPPAPVALRVLRAEGFAPRAQKAANAEPGVPSTLRHPFFPSASRRLLARGAGPGELVSVQIPSLPGERVRPRLHRFSGQVLAASFLGRRLVALVDDGGTVSIEIVGKGFREGFTKKELQLALGMASADAGLDPLFMHSGDLLWPSDHGLWRMDHSGWRQDGRITQLTAASSHRFDPPHYVCVRDADKLICLGGRILEVPKEQLVVIGAGLCATSSDGERWTVDGRGIRIQPGDTVLGLVADPWRVPALVTLTAGGVLVRVTRAGQNTVTRPMWSGLAAPPRIHPSQPLIVGRRDDGTVVVGDVLTGEVLFRMSGAAS